MAATHDLAHHSLGPDPAKFQKTSRRKQHIWLHRLDQTPVAPGAPSENKRNSVGFHSL